MPVAYLVGRREFYSLPFRVTPDVLIPRPETEFLVVALLDRIRRASGRAAERCAIADVGTGSGIIAICAAKHRAAGQVMAIDISPAALEVAADNARQHWQWPSGSNCVEGDLLAAAAGRAAVRFHRQQPALCQRQPRCERSAAT